MGLAGGLATNGGGLAGAAPTASPTFTGTVTAANLTATGTLSFPTGSIANDDLVNPPDLSNQFFRPTGVMGETIPRLFVSVATVSLATTTLKLSAIYLPKGTSVTNISWLSGTTPLAVGSNQWFSLFDNGRNKLAVTADDTSTAWAASTVKTLAVTGGPFVTTYDGLHFLGVLVVATTPPTLAGYQTLGTAVALTPALWGASTTGLSNPASCPSTAGAISAQIPAYGYVS